MAKEQYTHTTATGHEPAKSHGEIKIIMGALMMVLLLSALDQTIVSTALPKIASDLDGLTKLSWVATAYLLTSAIVTPIYGKLGDMYGRKKIFIVSILIFLFGSALCGLAQSMDQLVLFRAIQGIGGGGLMALVLAIIGDVVPPRQRGRYQGYFGAVFGLSSVLGPLLGGLFTEHLDWRWIFYINIPLGILALFAVITRLHLPVHKTDHKIDYVGASLLSLSVGALVLLTVWAGVEYAWTSPQIIGLGIASLVFAGIFGWWERRASEPLIPLGMFRNKIFSVSTLLSFMSGLVMFAAILYIPLYQQIVRGNTPTESGLLMLPLVAGMLTGVIGSGKIITKTGRYRIFPIIGGLLLALGLFLFSHLSLTTSHFMLSIWMVVIGLGLGMFMQVPTLAVQNAMPRKQLGTATSTVVFFRGIGGALGGAVFGTILTSRMTAHLGDLLPAGAGDIHSALSGGAAQLAQLPEIVRFDFLKAYVSSFHDMFLLAVPIALTLFVIALFLKDIPLRAGNGDEPAPAAH